MAHLLLDGSGAAAVAPDAAPLRVTGDIDIRVRVEAVDWSRNLIQQRLVSRREDPSNRSYELILETGGSLSLFWGIDGAATWLQKNSGTAVPFSDGVACWVRATLDVDNGAAGNDVKFYTSPDQATPSWTQLGSTVTTAGTTSIFAGTADLWVGGSSLGAGYSVDGKIYRAQVYDGIAGTLVFDADPSDPTTWTYA